MMEREKILITAINRVLADQPMEQVLTVLGILLFNGMMAIAEDDAQFDADCNDLIATLKRARAAKGMASIDSVTRH